MVLKNLSKKTILTGDLKIAQSFFDSLFGLHRKSNPSSLLFKTRFGIHTFGLKESIDVIVLDKNLKIVKVKENLKPNKLFFWNLQYSIVIELPKKTVNKSKTTIGDLIALTKS